MAFNQRAYDLVEDLERLLREFVTKNHVTHEEYRAATQLIVDSIKYGEETLVFDLFLETEAAESGSSWREGSPVAIEGPFYFEDAPILEGPPYVLPQRADEPGEVMFYSGVVSDTAGQPLAGVEVDIWQADARGQYSNIHEGVPPFNLRGRVHTDDAGFFAVRTVKPPPYEIPGDGPVGIMLDAIGRHLFRPAHVHAKFRHPGYEPLTTQLYVSGGDYLDTDVARAVKDNLIIDVIRVDSEQEIAARGLHAPFYVARYDVRLDRKPVTARL